MKHECFSGSLGSANIHRFRIPGKSRKRMGVCEVEDVEEEEEEEDDDDKDDEGEEKDD